MRALGLLCLLAAACPSQAQEAPAGAPNVLFIAVDDLNTAVGFLSEEPGNPLQTLYPDPAVRARIREVLTPNLDRLAATGVPFAHAYAASPICAPSRAAVMTGVRPHVSRFDDNGDGLWRQNPTLREMRTLPEHLRRHGYFAVGLGKIFHEWTVTLGAGGAVVADGPDVSRSWNEWINAGVGSGTVAAWSPWSTSGTEFRMGVTEEPLSAMRDVQNAAFVAELLRSQTATITDDIYDVERTITLPEGQPFFLALGIYRPHPPLVVPPEVLALFDPDELALSDSLLRVFADDTIDLSPGGRARVFASGGETVGGPTHDFYAHAAAINPVGGRVAAWKDLVRHYLAAVAMADRAIGQVLNALEGGPFADNTMVVLWGDHGWHLGEKTWFGKTTLWEESTQTVLVIRPPGRVSFPGVLRQRPVSLMDLYPTIAAVAGLPIPPHVQGADLRPALGHSRVPVASVALTTMGRDDHALRTAGYRYIRYGDNALDAELYDERADPDERTNLGEDDLRDALDAELDAALARDPQPVDTVAEAPLAYGLGPASPNPTGGAVSLALSLDASAAVEVEVTSVLGQRLWRQRLGTLSAGEHRLVWPGRDASGQRVGAGVYLLRVRVEGRVPETRRLVVLR